MKEQGRQILTTVIKQIDAEQRVSLRQFHERLSQPQPPLSEGGFGACFPELVLDPPLILETNVAKLKKVQRYEVDPSPRDVWLDDNGRPIRISEYEYETIFTYDENGYLRKASRTEGTGQGWDREFSYGMGGEQKQLERVEIKRFYASGLKSKRMQRGPLRSVDTINFDSNGMPDNLIGLVDIYLA